MAFHCVIGQNIKLVLKIILILCKQFNSFQLSIPGRAFGCQRSEHGQTAVLNVTQSTKIA